MRTSSSNDRLPAMLLVQRSANRDGSAISGQAVARCALSAGARVIAVFGHDGPAMSDYVELGCETHVVFHGGWLRPGGVIRSLRRILRERQRSRAFTPIILHSRPDLIYVNSLVSYAAALAAKRHGVPCVWHIRELFDDVGGEMAIPAFGGKRLVRREIRRLAQQLVVVSAAVSENVLGPELGARSEVIANPVGADFLNSSLDRESARRELGLPRESIIVGAVGSLRPVKGHGTLLNSTALLCRAFPQLVLAFAGCSTGEARAELASQAKRLAISDRLMLLGDVPDIRRFYDACDLICVASRSESFGRVAVEAYAAQRPIVATAVGGLREIITDDETGILVPYDDAPAMSRAIERILLDNRFREKLVSNGLHRFQEKYSAALFRDRMNTVLTKHLGGTDRLPLSDPRSSMGTVSLPTDGLSVQRRRS